MREPSQQQLHISTKTNGTRSGGNTTTHTIPFHSFINLLLSLNHSKQQQPHHSHQLPREPLLQSTGLPTLPVFYHQQQQMLPTA